MWYELETGRHSRWHLEDVQSIWPAPDGSDSELVISTEATVAQEVILATPRVCRLRFDLEEVGVTMTLGEQAPAPWPEVHRIKGRSFELMVTDKGPIMVPSESGKLPNRLASWMESVTENARSLWPVPPPDATEGTEWKSTPQLPGGLPPNTTSAKIRIDYRVDKLTPGGLEIAVAFGMRAVVQPPSSSTPHTAEGRGELRVDIDRTRGPIAAQREGVMELVRPSSMRNQVVRSRMSVSPRP